MAGKNIIKGLTVEIGGDTTKLGKALEDVTKKSKDISSELGEVNRLLKLDPGNTELQAQKQKLLADAVSNTKEKLDKLKEAEKQVQQQFERGEVSEEQVRALKREIIATEKKMEGYEKAIKETSGALDDMEEETEDVEESSSDLGGTLADVAKNGLAAVAAAATAVLGALTASAEETREYRREMGKLETAFTTAGHSSAAATKTYQTLQGILGETDQAVEAANHLAQLANNEEDLATWTNIATGVYAKFGASLPIENLTEAANETAKTGALTGGLADALNWAGVNEEQFQAQLDACTTEQERQALITETLNGLYSESAEKYREVNAEIIRANEANEAWTASLAEVGASVEPILTDIKMMGASMLSDLLPGITGVTDAFRALINGDEGGADALGSALSGLITQLLDKIVELAPSFVKVAVSLITTLVTTLIEMIPQLVTTLLSLISIVLEGLTAAIPQITQAITDMIPQLVNALVEGIPLITQGALQLLMALVDAVPKILPPLIAALPTITLTLVQTLADATPTLIEGALSLLMAIVDAIPLLIKELVPALPQIIDTIINTVIDNFPLLIDAAITLLMAIVEAIPEIIPPLVEALPQIIGSIVAGLIKAIPQLIQGGLKLFMGIVQAIPTFIGSLVKQLPSIITSIVKGLGSGIGKVADVGKDLIRGLWTGISNMVGWIGEKIRGFGESILGGLKDFFGIHSPSREMAWVGEMLDRGLAEGIEDSAKQPLDAVADLSNDMLDEVNGLNGLTLERQMQHTFADNTAQAQNNLLGRLDKILLAIEKGQILTIDGKSFVGATADQYDETLGLRRALAARGAV